jgi:hypothetical protein
LPCDASVLRADIAEKSLVNEVAVIEGVVEVAGVVVVAVEVAVVVGLLELPHPAMTAPTTNATAAPLKRRNFKSHLPLASYFICDSVPPVRTSRLPNRADCVQSC